MAAQPVTVYQDKDLNIVKSCDCGAEPISGQIRYFKLHSNS